MTRFWLMTLQVVLLVAGVNILIEWDGGWAGVIGGAMLGLFVSSLHWKPKDG